MASRCRSVSRLAVNLFKSSFGKPSSKPTLPNLHPVRLSPTFSRSIAQLGSLKSLLPLHSAVSSARLTSCLGGGKLAILVSGLAHGCYDGSCYQQYPCSKLALLTLQWNEHHQKQKKCFCHPLRFCSACCKESWVRVYRDNEMT